MNTARVAIVTGATNGIGRVTAHALAAAGMTVIVAARPSPRRGGRRRDQFAHCSQQLTGLGTLNTR